MKSNKLSIILYSISLIGVAAISVYTNMKAKGDIGLSIFIMLLTVVPAIYSFVPLMRMLLIEQNRSKNRLTSDVFTDRKQDLEHLLEILCSQDHRIEIKGEEECCGKTWLAMRLCDYINNPQDYSIDNLKSKIPYKRAFYFDLDKTNTETLNNFFNSNIIGSYDVIVFDHVINLDELICKQGCYHFQMVYIMKEPSDVDFASHYVSRFCVDDMVELHEKMRRTHPRLGELTRQEFDKLYELTKGNIGRVSGVLGNQRSIQWLKDIAYGKETEYDKELHKIQIELFVGNYKQADQMLQQFGKEYGDAMRDFMDINYKYILILSDCKHLLNCYNEAKDILSVIETTDYHTYNRNYEIQLHKAHYCKHLWDCDEALRILYDIKDVCFSAIVDSLGILAAKYFIDDLHVDFSEKNAIKVYEDYYICAQHHALESNQADKHKLMRHKAVYEYYTQEHIDINRLLADVNEIITIYNAENNRLLANAYFIEGEIYRLYKQYDNAIMSYKKCLRITDDNNIVIQVNLMVYYLKFIKKIDVNFDVIDSRTINKLCENNNYARKLYRRINCVELGDPNAEEIAKCFDSRIMPIL